MGHGLGRELEKPKKSGRWSRHQGVGNQEGGYWDRRGLKNQGNKKGAGLKNWKGVQEVGRETRNGKKGLRNSRTWEGVKRSGRIMG